MRSISVSQSVPVDSEFPRFSSFSSISGSLSIAVPKGGQLRVVDEAVYGVEHDVLQIQEVNGSQIREPNRTEPKPNREKNRN